MFTVHKGNDLKEHIYTYQFSKKLWAIEEHISGCQKHIDFVLCFHFLKQEGASTV